MITLALWPDGKVTEIGSHDHGYVELVVPFDINDAMREYRLLRGTT